jgi:teichuronic acid biosynthesis glycosyltransferase TuaC
MDYVIERATAIAREVSNARSTDSSDRRPKLRILTFTNLYPNTETPQKGVFVENRLRQLVGRGEILARVIAPIPWFPLSSPALGAYGRFARVPRSEMRNGIAIDHPRYPLIPKIGMTIAPLLMYLGVRRHIGRLIRSGYEFDLIDAHYFYPDGVVAAMLGRSLRKPVVITARGTDINVIAGHVAPRQMILWAADSAAAVISVSEALRQSMIRLGVDGTKIATLRNGVDLGVFRPLDRAAIRQRMGLDGQVLLTVGNVLESKGQAIVVEAMVTLPQANLLIVGSGPDEGRVRDIAKKLGLQDRVRFVGPVSHASLPDYYNAADVMVLATAREGWPNVVLEALACGTPVVATNVGGVPEIITDNVAGRLLSERSPKSVAEMVSELLARRPDRAAVRAHAEKYSWDEVASQQLALFARAVSRPGRGTSSSSR